MGFPLRITKIPIELNWKRCNGHRERLWCVFDDRWTCTTFSWQMMMWCRSLDCFITFLRIFICFGLRRRYFSHSLSASSFSFALCPFFVRLSLSCSRSYPTVVCSEFLMVHAPLHSTPITTTPSHCVHKHIDDIVVSHPSAFSLLHTSELAIIPSPSDMWSPEMYLFTLTLTRTRRTQFLFPDLTHNSFIFFLFFCTHPISVANNNSFSFIASCRLFVWVCVGTR